MTTLPITEQQERKGITLYQEQQEAIDKALPVLERGESILLIGGTGSGKTYVTGQLIERLQFKRNWQNILYITPKQVIYQTIHVLANVFKIDQSTLTVTSYDELKATTGEMWTEKEWEIEKIPIYLEDQHGNLLGPKIDPKTGEQEVKIKKKLKKITWREDIIKPDLVIIDECQNIKNWSSMQTKMMHACRRQFPEIQFICMSATAGQNLAELRAVTCLLKIKVESYINYLVHDIERYELEYSIEERKYINPANYKGWADEIAGKTSIWDHNQAAMNRYCRKLGDNYVLIETAKMPVRCFIRHTSVDFENQQEKDAYHQVFNKLVTGLAELDPRSSSYQINILVEMLRFRQATELIRAPRMAQAAFNALNHEDRNKRKTPIIGVNFNDTCDLVQIRLLKLGVKEEEISVIRGGQSNQVRAKQIMNFQKGISKYMILNVKAGGVGLSLQHNESNRNRTFPRIVIVPPVWSGIDMVQFLGRAYRRDTISTTYQQIIWYKGTIEDKVSSIMKHKMKAISGMTSKGEAWSEAFFEEALGLSKDKLERQRMRDGREKAGEGNDTGEDSIESFGLVSDNLLGDDSEDL